MFTGLITSVLIPIVTDFFKTSAPAVSRKFFGESVDDQIKLENAAIEKLKVLAGLDNPNGTPSQWVVDLRAAYRYVAATVLIGTGVIVAAWGISSGSAEVTASGLEMASYPFGFIFGERLVLSYKPQGK